MIQQSIQPHPRLSDLPLPETTSGPTTSDTGPTWFEKSRWKSSCAVGVPFVIPETNHGGRLDVVL